MHVVCDACGDTQRIDQPQHDDDFTQRVLMPFGSWWVTHREPRLVLVELVRDGVYAEWEAAGRGVDS